MCSDKMVKGEGVVEVEEEEEKLSKSRFSMMKAALTKSALM